MDRWYHHPRVVDVIFLSFALLMGVFAFLVNIRNLLAVPMGNFYGGGDNLSLATFAYALLHPELFVGDAFLANPNHILVQDGIFLRALMGLGSLFPDMGYAMAFLSIPLIFLHLSGFYLLGRVLMGERLPAILLSLACFVNVDHSFDGWAYSATPMSRATAAAYWPFLLAGFIHWRQQTEKWPLLMIAAGAMSYGYIINGPFLSLALWGGLWAFKPTTWSWGRMVPFMAFCGMAGVAVQLPKIAQFLSTMDAHEGVSYATQLEIMHYNDHVNWLLRLPKEFKEYVLHAMEPWVIGHWLTATLGVGLMVWRVIPDRPTGLFFINITAIILIVGAALPLGDTWLARGGDRFPMFATASKNMPFLFPLMLILCFYTIHQLARRWQKPYWGVVISCLALLTWQGAHGGKEWQHAVTLAHCWKDGHLICPPQGDTQASLYQAVRETVPPGQLVMAAGVDYPLRIIAKVPLVFARRDQKYLVATSKTETLRWYEKSKAMDQIRQIADPTQRLLQWRQLARSWGAKFLILSRNDWLAVRNHPKALAAVFPKILRTTPEVGIFSLQE